MAKTWSFLKFSSVIIISAILLAIFSHFVVADSNLLNQSDVSSKYYFRNSNINQAFAFKINLVNSLNISNLSIWVNRVGAPTSGNLTASIASYGAGVPDYVNVIYSSSNYIAYTDFLQSPSFKNLSFNNVALSPGNYFIILNFSASIDANHYLTLYGLASAPYTLYRLNAGTWETRNYRQQYILFGSSDYYPVGFLSPYNATLNVTLINNISSAIITDTNLTITYANHSSQNYTNVSNNFIVNVTSGSPINISAFNNIAYANFNYTYTPNSNQSQYLNLSVNPYNSVRIRVYNVTSGALINSNVNINMVSDSEEIYYTNSTANGTFNYYNLTPSNYSLSFTHVNYTGESYNIEVSNFSSQSLNVYLGTYTTNTYFTMKSISTGQVISDCIFSTYKIINGSLTLISVLRSDLTGKVSINYAPTTYYKFIVSCSGYSTREFSLNPVIFSNYDVPMIVSASAPYVPDSVFRIYYNVSPIMTNANNTLVFSFVSPSGSFQSYNVSIVYHNTTYFLSDTNAYGNILSYVLDVENASTLDYVYMNYSYLLSSGTSGSNSLSQQIEGTLNGSVSSNIGETYGLGILERLLIYLVIVVIFAGVGFLIGGEVGAGLLSIVIGGFFVVIGFLPIWLVAPSFVLMGFMLVFGGSHRG